MRETGEGEIVATAVGRDRGERSSTYVCVCVCVGTLQRSQMENRFQRGGEQGDDGAPRLDDVCRGPIGMAGDFFSRPSPARTAVASVASLTDTRPALHWFNCWWLGPGTVLRTGNREGPASALYSEWGAGTFLATPPRFPLFDLPSHTLIAAVEAGGARQRIPCRKRLVLREAICGTPCSLQDSRNTPPTQIDAFPPPPMCETGFLSRFPLSPCLLLALASLSRALVSGILPGAIPASRCTTVLVAALQRTLAGSQRRHRTLRTEYNQTE